MLLRHVTLVVLQPLIRQYLLRCRSILMIKLHDLENELPVLLCKPPSP